MTYIVLSDIRAAGLPDIVADDDAVNAAILLWQEVIDRYTRQWFEPREVDFKCDGTDSDALHFAIPLITVSALYINDEANPLDPMYYKVYNARSGPEDDRRNPRIKIRALNDFADIYTAPLAPSLMKFRKGRQNQRVVGTMGFTEADGSTPAAIKRALTKLVIQKLTTPIYIAPGVVPPAPPPIITSGVVTEEWTDGHKIKYADTQQTTPRRPDNMSDVISDPEVRGLLKLYRAPIGLAAPAHPSYLSG
jgi:hypothetical protein